MRRTLVVSLVMLTSTAGVGLAEERDCAAQRRGDPRAVCQLSMDGEEIERELPRWLDDQLIARTFAEHGTLIRLRADFLDRIVHSADDL
jgi:hypothetical protein